MQAQKKIEMENIKDNGHFGQFVKSMAESCVLSRDGEEYYKCLVSERNPLLSLSRTVSKL